METINGHEYHDSETTKPPRNRQGMRIEVRMVVGGFKGSSFDGTDDSTSYHNSELNGELVHFAPGFIHAERHLSPAFEAELAVGVERFFPGLTAAAASGAGLVAFGEARYLNQEIWRASRDVSKYTAK